MPVDSHIEQQVERIIAEAKCKGTGGLDALTVQIIKAVTQAEAEPCVVRIYVTKENSKEILRLTSSILKTKLLIDATKTVMENVKAKISREPSGVELTNGSRIEFEIA